MSDYRVATGSDISLGSLTVLSPQPRSDGVKYTRTTHGATGIVYREGPYLELEWSVLGSATAYQTLLGTFGLSSAQSALVTVYARDERFTYTRWNGRAVLPLPGAGVDWAIFPRGIRILIRDLEVAS